MSILVDISSWLAIVIRGLAVCVFVLSGALLLVCDSAWCTVLMRRCLLVVVGLGCSVLRVVRCHPCLVVVLLAALGGEFLFGGACCCFGHIP